MPEASIKVEGGRGCQKGPSLYAYASLRMYSLKISRTYARYSVQ